ncbi:MAG: hypothetical protein ACRDLL_06775 [Solirubrobacterales bacterium]
MRLIRRHLIFANVVSVLALFVALGGTALAGVMITQNRQVSRGTISGHHPPSGDHPNIIAGSLRGADLSRDFKASLRLHCPAGLQDAGDVCFESSGHVGDPLVGAVKTCADEGLRLPTLPELALVFEHAGAPQIAQWVATEYADDNGTVTIRKGALLSENASRQLSTGTDSASQSYHYRCVTSATN